MRKIKTTIKNPELVEKRRNQILEAATELFRKEGYHATTMRKICKKAKFNQGSFYDYFESKEDILVYIYNKVMHRKLDGAAKDQKVSGLKDIEKFLKALIFNAWNREKNRVQMLYRETNSLDKKTMHEVLKLEAAHIKWIAEKLREGLGLPSVNQELEIIANLAAYIYSFIPLRGWNLHHLDKNEVLDFAVGTLMNRLKELMPDEEANT